MKLSEHKELKNEILAMPSREKDKLLLRLVAKDKVLTERLHFVLLEDESHLNERVLALRREIENAMGELSSSPKNNAKDTLVVLRKLMRQINHFYKVTKADFEEIELKLLLFSAVSLHFKYKVYSRVRDNEQLLANYIVKSMLIIVRKFEKLHEDLQFDLKNTLKDTLGKIHESYVGKTASHMGLPWGI